MPPNDSAIQPQGLVANEATAVYGEGESVLRIGNGGAGATGLFEVLAYDYLTGLPHDESIAWVCNHSRNTQVALHRGYIDIALTYERDQEVVAASEGRSHTVGCIFHDHFCLAGPKSDPANVKSSSSLMDALLRIASRAALFHSRADGSATMTKEHSLWLSCGLQPWDNEATYTWYRTSLDGPVDALKSADAAGAYILTDRSTLLRQTGLRTVHQTTVFLEPKSPDDPLMNSCYALCSTSATPEVTIATRRFINYLLSARGQRVIRLFGINQCGLPFFASVEQGFARTRLAGGVPKDGKWVMMTK